MNRFFYAAVAAVAIGVTAYGQSPSSLYTWSGIGNTQQWFRNFGAGGSTAVLTNNTPGALTITETSGAGGASQAFSDNFNRVRERSVVSSGGLDLTGLSSLKWRIGHNGSSPVNVQFFVQATPSSSYVALGPDVAIQPGMNTYSVPLTGLTPAQAVYIRTLGVNIRDHSGQGNLIWTIEELLSAGSPLTQRDLVTFDNGAPEGGLQGAIANFDVGAIAGNNGGQNQTGLSHNAAGSGSLQWTDLGGSDGAAISWGNGTAWNGNTFNNRTTDVSNYTHVIIRMSATDPTGAGGSLGVQSFFQTNNFNFQTPGNLFLPIDGQYHDLTFSLAGLLDMDLVDTTGINLFSHAQDLIMNIDNVRFVTVPEPATACALGLCVAASLRRRRRA